MAKHIEHEAAISVIEEKQKELCPVGMYSRHAVYGHDREKFDAWQEIIDTIESIPAADVRLVVRGKWIDVSSEHIKVFRCDQCGEETTDTCMDKPRANFCPNCGADMREANDGT